MKGKDIETELGSKGQTITFKHLSEHDDLAAHEIIAKLFAGMSPTLAAAESAWVQAFVKTRGESTRIRARDK